ncbi:MAG: DUF3168 domain-containing protein [Bradyrhizobium sp.]|nr:DUF3168 domain-containing protein [Bradyrhizobium sp.]
MSATIRDAIYYELSNAAAITALVSTRIYPAGDVPQAPTLPYLAWFKVDNQHTRHQSGGSDLAQARFQIDAWATTATAAEAIYEALRGVLDNYSGDMGDPGDSVTVRSCVLDTDSSGFIPPTAGGPRGLQRQTMDFLIWYRED